MIDLQSAAIKWAAIATMIGAAWIGGCTRERFAWEAKVSASEAIADSKTEGLKHELDHIKTTNQQVQDFIADIHQRDLDSLRNRPPRRVEVIRGGACEGVSGAQLSGPDAQFLTGEAARAERIRQERDEVADKFNALLKTCGG